MTEEEINEFADNLEYTNGIYGFKQGVKLQKQKQDEFAINFAEWCMDKHFSLRPYNMYDLLEQFKKEKGL